MLADLSMIMISQNSEHSSEFARSDLGGSKAALRPKRLRPEEAQYGSAGVDTLAGESNQSKRRRNRVMRSCVPCHKHKRKCDRGRPCARCVNMGCVGSCIYETEEFLPASPQDTEAQRLRKRVAELEAVVRSLRGFRPAGCDSPSLKDEDDSNGGMTPLIPSKLDASDDSDSEMDGDGSPALVSGLNATSNPALINAPQKMRLPAEPFQAKLVSSSDAMYSDAGPQMLIGAAASPLLLSRLDTLAKKPGLVEADLVYDGLFPSENNKTLRWNGLADSKSIRRAVLDNLPTTEVANKLLKVFQDKVEIQHRAWFSPSLADRFSSFFAARDAGRPKHGTVLLALMCATLAISCHVLPINEADSLEASLDIQLPVGSDADTEVADVTPSDRFARFYAAAALALLDNTGNALSIEGVQVQLMLCIFLPNAGYTQLFTTMLPGMIRIAQALGLHIDPKKLYRSMPFVEQEIRRRMWWSIQEHDIAWSLLTGLPPLIGASDCGLFQDRTEISLLGPCAEDPEPLPECGATRSSYHVYRSECTLYAREILVKVMKLASWHWGSSPTEESVPVLDEVNRVDVAIKLWYGRIPPSLRYEIEDSRGGQLPSPRLHEKHSSQRDATLVMQSLLLAIHAQYLLMILHRPFLLSAVCHSSIAHTAERQVFSSALAVISARCLLGSTRLDFWTDAFSFSAALTLVHLASRVSSPDAPWREEYGALKAGVKAAVDHFGSMPGTKNEERARILTALLEALRLQTEAQSSASGRAFGQEPLTPHTPFTSQMGVTLLDALPVLPADVNNNWSSLRTSLDVSV